MSVADRNSLCNSVSSVSLWLKWRLVKFTTETKRLHREAADHFFNPRNVGDAAEPSFAGRAASLRCGAHVRFSIQVDEANAVSQAKFRAAGCNVLVAAASVLTEQVTGLSTADAAVVGQNPAALIEQLGVEQANAQCAEMACEALLDAIRDYSNAAREDWAQHRRFGDVTAYRGPRLEAPAFALL